MSALREAIVRLVEGRDLSGDEAEAAMGAIMAGEATDAQIGAFMAVLRLKGETVEEVAGCARAMRARATRVSTGRRPLVDTCGTGGDGSGTFN
ncbi:MAG: anthranilate phosphoribosyltransferase, partial [Clostridia bacterium]|nr:anthranilate phosphoribosyltransferase [Clostridia bacterium]